MSSRRTLHGKYQVQNIEKYDGDHTDVTFRSSWEASFCRWLDFNPDVKSWSSEEVVVPYMSPIDNKVHRYFVDFLVRFNNGHTLLIEIKPDYQTKKPVMKKGRRKASYLAECQTFAVNWSKWKTAERFAEERGWEFSVFTEHTLKGLGIKIPSTLPRGKR